MNIDAPDFFWAIQRLMALGLWLLKKSVGTASGQASAETVHPSQSIWRDGLAVVGCFFFHFPRIWSWIWFFQLHGCPPFLRLAFLKKVGLDGVKWVFRFCPKDSMLNTPWEFFQRVYPWKCTYRPQKEAGSSSNQPELLIFGHQRVPGKQIVEKSSSPSFIRSESLKATCLGFLCYGPKTNISESLQHALVVSFRKNVPPNNEYDSNTVIWQGQPEIRKKSIRILQKGIFYC